MIDPPLTFERNFADPLGDLAWIQDALSRPERLLIGDQTNWELKETCHADAFMNFALVNRFCSNGGIGQRSKAIYGESDNPTLEQDRFMWRQLLEYDWVRMKCDELDSTLELRWQESEHHPELTELILKQGDYYEADQPEVLIYKLGARVCVASYHLITTLIEMVARLGDDPVGLTQPFTRAKQIVTSMSRKAISLGILPICWAVIPGRNLLQKKS